MLVETFLHRLQLCARRQTPFALKKLHAQILKAGLQDSGPLPNTLVNIYGKCGLLQDALHLFHEMPYRDPVSWASILTVHTKSNFAQTTLSIFPSMFALDGLLPDHFVFASLVKACAKLGALRQGKQVHARFMSSQFRADDVVKSSLVDFYSKCGLPNDARKVFDSILFKNSVSWTAMIYGYARSGRKSDAIDMFESMSGKNLFSWTALISGFVQSANEIDAVYLFIKMLREGISLQDPFVLSSIAGACANLALLELGKQIHCLVVVRGYDSSLFINNALVDMYAKCSDVSAANNVFWWMRSRDVVSWTSIIVGSAQHGRAEEALGLYNMMLSADIKPNEVTFVGLIYACSHAGLVGKGRDLFKSMINDYGISPSLQHYTCLLDLLSRSGHLDEAEDLIHSMPFTPDEPTWAALISACNQHGNLKMGIRVADHLLNLKPEDPSSYILLSNTYATSAMWDNVSKLRKLMVSMEIKKEPGYSCIEFGKEKHVFHAGEPSHSLDEIFYLLTDLDAKMRKRGYIPDTSSVLHDIEQQGKEMQLFWHSERSAVAYGLLKAVPGTVIRIIKNLRVCGDCHTVLKYISSIVKREIVVRDATRYHHFKDGSCTCNDFW